MVNWILKKIVGSKNQREVRKLRKVVEQINEIEPTLNSLSDDELRQKTANWKADLAKIADPNEQQVYLNQILPEAFAVVKNGARRLCGKEAIVSGRPVVWNMVHFDVQLIGGMVLHQGKIAEMATGEGKTLVATLPLYLNALTGRGAHLVTVNDYLAKRDSDWMGFLFNFLGLTVGCIQNEQPPEVRREQYYCDITYGTNSEFGFDYLRDNGMATTKETQVQRGYAFAIVDEVDSILIDEARTPLIISGPTAVTSEQYNQYKPLVEQLVRKQALLCNRIASEGDELFAQGKPEEAAKAFFKLKLGQPRHKSFLHAMEDPDQRRAIEKCELSYYSDTLKEEFFKLKEELYFTIDERANETDLSEMGREFLSPGNPNAFVLPDLISEFAEIDLNREFTEEQKIEEKSKRQAFCDSQAERMHSISQLLRAFCLFEKDVQYVIEENKVVIVDEYTGRKMPGRRWSDGLHQAVEAKEGVQVDRETQTLATITIQNYFRLYFKLAGMTGTAETEANEFHDIYKLDVVVIPTNRPCIRKDLNDLIFKTRREKFNAVVAEIKRVHDREQPVLVGTVSVESSELLSRMLKREKIPHTVLNAKFHAQEAEIVARAGQPGAVTISTNMAGRGTDIKLGPGVRFNVSCAPHPEKKGEYVYTLTDAETGEVRKCDSDSTQALGMGLTPKTKETGGLYVLGTERHESRRIDRQLRGRCSRQGDPGLSRFYVSFEDDLMRNFGAADRMTKIMERFGMKEGEELEHPWLNKSVETAQRRVEQRNYSIRRRTLEFDDVMNKQREVIYGLRNETIETAEPRKIIYDIMGEAIPAKVQTFMETEDGTPNYAGLLAWANTTFPLGLTAEKTKFEGKNAEEVSAWLIEKIKASYELKSKHEDPDAVTSIERYIILNAIDRLWQEHLYAMDSLREGVHLRAYGQKDPLIEYKNEAYSMFVELMTTIKREILHNLFRSTSNLQAFEQFLSSLPANMLQQQGGSEESITSGTGAEPAQAATAAAVKTLPVRHEQVKVGRNDPCPCGSGRKYKSCCGRKA